MDFEGRYQPPTQENDAEGAFDQDEAHARRRKGRRRPAPGKVTRTLSFDAVSAAVRGVHEPGAIQADGGRVAPMDPFEVHLLARRGVSGGAAELPHLAIIQRAFGRHDVSGVRAHVGGVAAEAAGEIGARAYATGDDIAFAGTPDVRQAAHEAAHVVQQRGGVQLDGGVGARGDIYERHADAVADLVVRGQSAESLLDTMAHRAASTPAAASAVQRIDRDGDGIDDDAAACTAGPWTPTTVANARSEIGTPPCKTLGGQPITVGSHDTRQVRIGGRTYVIKIDERAHWFGIIYGGRPTLTETTIDELCASTDPAYFDERDRHVAAGARAHVRSEGSVSSLNTWDTQYVTIAGRGWLSGNAQQLLDLAESEARRLGQTLDLSDIRAKCAELGAPSPLGSAGPRFNMTTITGLAAALEDSTVHRFMTLAFLRHSMRTFYSEDTRDPTDADRDRLQEGLDAGLDDVIIGAATHFELGMPGYFPNPMEAAIDANTRYPQDPAVVAAEGRDYEQLSRQLAYLMKRRIAGYLANNSGHGMSSQAYGAVTTQKTSDFDRHFQHLVADTGGETGGHVRRRRPNAAQHNDGRVFFRNDAAAELVPALDGSSHSRPPAGHLYVQVGSVYRDFGDPPLGLGEPAVPAAADAPPVSPDRGQIDAHVTGRVHREAQRGVQGSGGTLPHLEAIQRSFGHHEVSGIHAHVGGAATDAANAIGAKAYATGDAVAFAESPDLRQAAHEAAHIVQQRGGVRLDGGVGRAGDPYEQHADAVAERVVRGESAEGLLDTMAHRGAAGGPAVQRDAASLAPVLRAITAETSLDRLERASSLLQAAMRRGTSSGDVVELELGGASVAVSSDDVPQALSALDSRVLELNRAERALSSDLAGSGASAGGPTAADTAYCVPDPSASGTASPTISPPATTPDAGPDREGVRVGGLVVRHILEVVIPIGSYGNVRIRVSVEGGAHTDIGGDDPRLRVTVRDEIGADGERSTMVRTTIDGWLRDHLAPGLNIVEDRIEIDAGTGGVALRGGLRSGAIPLGSSGGELRFTFNIGDLTIGDDGVVVNGPSLSANMRIPISMLELDGWDIPGSDLDGAVVLDLRLQPDWARIAAQIGSAGMTEAAAAAPAATEATGGIATVAELSGDAAASGLAGPLVGGLVLAGAVVGVGIFLDQLQEDMRTEMREYHTAYAWGDHVGASLADEMRTYCSSYRAVMRGLPIDEGSEAARRGAEAARMRMTVLLRTYSADQIREAAERTDVYGAVFDAIAPEFRARAVYLAQMVPTGPWIEHYHDTAGMVVRVRGAILEAIEAARTDAR